MVVGEREIVGQLRNALKAAQQINSASGTLVQMVEQALKCSRAVAVATDLGNSGRSVVSVALELAGVDSGSCLVIGTGSYAGAVVRALRDRGVTDIVVSSRSGRAADFASSHQLAIADSLPDALAHADLVICCSGTGGHALDETAVAQALGHPRRQGLTVIDLALTRDVAPGVADLPGVRLITLDDVGKCGGGASPAQLETARAIVEAGVREFVASLGARRINPAVLALRELVQGFAEDEIARLPRGVVPRQAAEDALRRLAARMLHAPTTRAHDAAASGRPGPVLAALDALYDIAAPTDQEVM